MTPSKLLLCLVLILSLAPAAQAQQRGRLRAILQQASQDHRQDPSAGRGQAQANRRGQQADVGGARIQRDVSYGTNPAQKMDVYLPQQAVAGAPVIMMVHGGGWRRGDKAAPGVADNKVKRWTARGAIVVSINYRLLPEAQVDIQAQDVAQAARYLQRNASTWGGDGRRLILMGHSAGAHLVSLVAANTQRYQVADVLGTVALDSGAMDVPGTMKGRHFDLHDDAFGTDPQYWVKISPVHALVSHGAPMLLVCSSERSTSCPEAIEFATRAHSLGRQAQVLPEAMSHGEINHDLGLENDYTRQVELFLGRIAPELR